MSAQMNESLFKKNFLILGIGRLVTTEYRVLPNVKYSAEPSNRTEYRFSPNFEIQLYQKLNQSLIDYLISWSTPLTFLPKTRSKGKNSNPSTFTIGKQV